MALIVNERWDRLKRRLSRRAWSAIQDKARWESISLSAAVANYPGLIPAHLQKLARSCFVATRRECLEARRSELLLMLREVERQLRKVHP